MTDLSEGQRGQIWPWKPGSPSADCPEHLGQGCRPQMPRLHVSSVCLAFLDVRWESTGFGAEQTPGGTHKPGEETLSQQACAHQLPGPAAPFLPLAAGPSQCSPGRPSCAWSSLEVHSPGSFQPTAPAPAFQQDRRGSLKDAC